jgi:hypothetical protein
VSVPAGIIQDVDETRGWLPEDLAVMPPGPQLATLLAGVDRARLSDEDLVTLTQARHRLVAHIQAQLLADLHAVGTRSDQAVGRQADSTANRWGEVEIAFALTWTSRAADTQLGLADDVIDRLPVVFAALDSGTIDIPKAGCRVAARQCDVDHTKDWVSSKDSRRCNLACLCKKHHLFKHLTGSELIQITPGVLGWRTPLGKTYITTPEPYPHDPLSHDPFVNVACRDDVMGVPVDEGTAGQQGQQLDDPNIPARDGASSFD